MKAKKTKTRGKSKKKLLDGQKRPDGLVDGLVGGLAENQQIILQIIKNCPRISGKVMAETIAINTTAIDKNIEKIKGNGSFEAGWFSQKWILGGAAVKSAAAADRNKSPWLIIPTVMRMTVKDEHK